MPILVKIIGIFITTIGAWIFVYPKNTRNMMLFWRQGKNIYAAGLIRILFGSIFLFSAGYCRIPQAIFILGILIIFGGFLIFILGIEKTKTIIEQVEKKSDLYLRLLSLLVFIFGAFIVFSA